MKYLAVPAYARATMAAFLWGTAGVASRLATPNIPAAAFADARLLIGGIILTLMLGSRRLSTARDINQRGSLLLAALALAAFQWSFFVAVADMGAALATLLTTTAALLVASFLTATTQRANLTTRWWIAAILGITGGALILAHGRAVLTQGIGFAILSGALYAVFTQATAALQTREGDGLACTALALLIAELALTPAAAPSLSLFLSPRNGLIALYLGLATTAFAYGLYVTALKVLTPC
ncbi:MAG: EamA family transporter [Acidiferrobacter sp.]